MFAALKSLFSPTQRYAKLSRHDLNGIATCAWQRVQSRALAKQALEQQFPNFLLDVSEEVERIEEARGTENMVSHAINSTPNLMTGSGAYQAEAPILDIAAARESTIDTMERVAVEDLKSDEQVADTAVMQDQAARVAALQQRIAELQSRGTPSYPQSLPPQPGGQQ